MCRVAVGRPNSDAIGLRVAAKQSNAKDTRGEVKLKRGAGRGRVKAGFCCGSLISCASNGLLLLNALIPRLGFCCAEGTANIGVDKNVPNYPVIDGQ